MHAEDWDDVKEYSIMRCTECNKFTWLQDDTEDFPEQGCRLCGAVLLFEITCKSIGITINGESYFDIDGELVHENEISIELFESL